MFHVETSTIVLQKYSFFWRKLIPGRRYGDGPIIAALSIVEEGDVKKIRMGHLAVIGANKVNGVAAIHTEIIKKDWELRRSGFAFLSLLFKGWAMSALCMIVSGDLPWVL